MSTAGVRSTVAFVALMFTATTAWAQQASSSQGNLQGFSVVLVLGDLQDGSSSDNIPAAARAALGDLRDFLPYRSYRVLDTAWILGSTSQLFRGTSRLRGAEEQVYEVSFTSSPTGPSATPSLQVRFSMNEGDYGLKSPDAARREAQLKAELVQTSAARAALEKEMQSSNFSGSAQERKAYIAEAQARMRDMQRMIDAMQTELRASTSNQTLIDTSFNMRIGETVVVGTSRVRGDKALIALLTAVRK